VLDVRSRADKRRAFRGGTNMNGRGACSPIPYRDIWERELRAGKGGQRRECSSTWRLDGLWRAVCYQLRAEESERLLASAIDNGALPCALAALLDEYEREWEQAHRAFVDSRSGVPGVRHAA
jgi:hypothetical protein